MIYHQCCKICKKILTIEEMQKHLVDFMGSCNKCREHAKTLKERLEKVEEINEFNG